MSDLTFLIDNLPTPELPSCFSADECRILHLAIAAAKQQAQPYNGDFTAPWLLSPFDSAEWITTHRGREELVNGSWHKAIVVNWKVRLPNGSYLTDAKYRNMLDLNRRVAFLMRSGHVGGNYAPVSWRITVSVLLQITRWTVLHESEFFPERFGFKLLDQFAVDSLLRTVAVGGWTEALRVVPRLLAYFYRGAYGKPCPQHLFESAYELPLSIRSDITRWLENNKYYGRVRQGAYKNRAHLMRERLADDIGEPVDSMRGSWKLSAFCRQFEKELQVGALLVSIYQPTEKPDHKTKTVEDVVNAKSSERTLQFASNCLTTILSAHRHLPDLLPEPALISVKRASSLAETLTRQSGHHQFMPIDIGLTYFNHAIRHVHIYGEALIDYYLAVLSSERKIPASTTPLAGFNKICGSSLALRFTVDANGLELPVGTILGIKEFMREETPVDFQRLREQPTLDQALRILIGACVVCIAIMKPAREDELTHLQRDCLRQDSDGYLLHFELGKSNSGEAYQVTDKPIPVITAKAIQLLQKLGSGLVSVFGDTRKISNNLFYLPKQDGLGARVPDPGLLNQHLDLFCDYVGLAPDHLGRRWYVRIHEMRKWFLLLLFWSGKYDVLDAARWIAGHTNASHVYAYIERELPGEELPKLEAEYAIDRLRALESSGNNRSLLEAGLDVLYERVLAHFQVQSLSLIPESEWTDYVVALREAQGFVLEPHSVYGEIDKVEVIGINVSFVVRDAT